MDLDPSDWREARRLRAYKLKQKGWRQTDIAEALGVSDSAVSHWMKKAREGGKEALKTEPRSGRPPKLSEEERTERLPELLEKGPEHSALRAKPSVFRALTGLSPQEFEALLPSFNEAWEDFVQATFIDGKSRKRAFGGGRRPRLKTGRAKLLFILFYLRIHPIQEVQGFFFGLSQGQANCWIHRLMPILSQALGREAVLPERRPCRLEEVLRQYPVLQTDLPHPLPGGD